MLPTTKRWEVAEPLPPQAAKELEEFPPIVRQILYHRGYRTLDEAWRFWLAERPPGTQPNALLGMDAAVERIVWGIQHGEQIAVYGDYDVDGVTATALLTHALRVLGANVQEYIPHRFDEGYGLNNEALDTLRTEGVRLVITVDCGIRSPEEARHAVDLGIDMIISDHHDPAAELPNVVAVINPKQQGCSYPEKTLAGVGLAYKLAAALMERLGQTAERANEYLDLVALGTVADLAPLKGENRALVREGLFHIRRPRRQGLLSLMGVANLNFQQKVSATDISFVLGPRLNAAGRLDSARAALNLLLTDDVNEAGRLAQQLDDQNRMRQRITREIQEHAETLAFAEQPDALLLFAADSSYNSGVVGLAASRLTERYYRPAIVASQGEEFTRGSCRSISEFNITEALDQCADLLVRHGGHAAAAGFTVHNDNLPELKERLEAIACDQLSHLDLRPKLKADVEVPLSDLRPELLKDLTALEPTGFQNPAVKFVSRDLKVLNSRVVGKECTHLKLTVTDSRIVYDAIAFGLGHWQSQLPQRIDLLYHFEVNDFNGRSSLQLNVRDLKPTGTPD